MNRADEMISDFSSVYAAFKVISKKKIRKLSCHYETGDILQPQNAPSQSLVIFLDWSRKGLYIHIHRGGLQSRTFTYITDITEVIKTVISHSEPPPVVNISSSESRTVLYLIHIVMDTTGHRVP